MKITWCAHAAFLIEGGGPRIVVPMHYALPGRTTRMLPVTAFTDRFPAEAVTWSDGPSLTLTRADLPESPRIVVLQPSTA